MSFRYKFLGNQSLGLGDSPLETLNDMCFRFHTDISSIFEETRKGPPPLSTADMAIEPERHNSIGWRPAPGAILYIPTPPDPSTWPGGVEWQTVSTEGKTLKELFEKLRAQTIRVDGNARENFYKMNMVGVSTIGTFSERDAYFHWRNQALRETVLRRYAAMHPHLDMLNQPMSMPPKDISPEDAPLQDGDKIAIPVKIPPLSAVPVAPSGTSTIDTSQTAVQTANIRLTQILWACRALENTRKACQVLQGKCMGELKELASLREVLVIQHQAQNLPQLHAAEVKVRQEAISAIDELIKQASETMLSDAPSKVPAGEGGGALVAQCETQAKYLGNLLRNQDTVKVLYVALSEHGDLPFYEGVSPGATAPVGVPKQTVLQAACQISIAATIWFADVADAGDAKSILEGAIGTISTGTAPTANAKNVLDLVASMAFAPKDSAASSAVEPLALCSAIDSVYMALMAGEAAKADSVAPLTAAQKKVEETTDKLIKPLLRSLGVNEALTLEDLKPLFETIGKGLGIKGAVAEGTEQIQAKLQGVLEEAASERSMNAIKKVNDARSKFGDARIKEAYEKLAAFSAPENPFPTKLASVLRRLKPIGAVIGVLSTLKKIVGIAKTPDTGPVQNAAGAVSALKGTGDVVSVYGGGVKALKALKVITPEAAERVAIYVGRVSMVLEVALATAEVCVAIEKHDYYAAAGAGMSGTAMVLFLAAPETGGITFVIGAVVLVTGLILQEHVTIVEIVTPEMKLIFTHRLDEFAKGKERLGQYFVTLAPAIQNVKKAVEESSWTENLPLYAERLRANGFPVP